MIAADSHTENNFLATTQHLIAWFQLNFTHGSIFLQFGFRWAASFCTVCDTLVLHVFQCYTIQTKETHLYERQQCVLL